MLGAVRVKPGAVELDGKRLVDMSTQTRVLAITRDNAAAKLHPQRNVRLSAGDTAYILGPYRELLGLLRKGQFGISAAKTG